ncbi:transposase [Bacillus pseudomycoides]|uniref:transposase n=1 Tax=Bacillus pseudomycoides TaxID=64104 RepID=UPI00211D3AF9|nr:transposase [Bacillus pseudomycoides]
MVKKGDKFQTYSDELKIQVVKSYLNGEGSQTAIAKKYKLKNTVNELGPGISRNRRYYRLAGKQRRQ